MALAIAAVVAFAAAGSAAEMASLPAGGYAPFFKSTAGVAGPTRVAAFRLDALPVTNQAYLAFVVDHPEWRRSQIKRLYADARYLRRWRDDLDLNDETARAEPVTDVSWFAAVAYCKASGLRLPTTEQWEYALADDGRATEAVRERFLAWMSEPNGARPGPVGGAANGFGVRDLAGLVWEWTLDFDAFAVTAEPRDSEGKDGALTCGAGAAGAADATDYPAFMRYSLRASLKASYTADNVGFRCAGDLR